jgi:uncharacterized membrane protein YgcG
LSHMRYRKTWTILTAALLGLLPGALIAGGSEEPSTPIPVTPADSEGYAVFFADNMAFAPQWRTGNLVRIEAMVLKAGDFNGDGVTNASDIPLDVSLGLTQAELTANPALILDTYMVSVPEIWVTISGPGGTYEFYSYFADGTADESDMVGREINKAGHLIYGFLWDTTGVDPGVYKTSVVIPSEYDVIMAIESLTVAEDAEPIGFVEVPTAGSEPVSGTGGVIDATNEAFIYLGEIVLRGGSGSNGGNGGNGGNGNDDGGTGGSGHGRGK